MIAYIIVLGAREYAEQRVTAAINTLHENNLVHGDLRSSNILLYGSTGFIWWENGGNEGINTNTGNKKVAIIDFDWSGPPTQNYPFFMNHSEELKWPEGAEDGKPLAFQPDNDWIARKFV